VPSSLASPLVSIIIPAYNRADLISDSLESALNQTYSNHEIIVVDDGSTDRTWDVLTGYGDRIKAIRQPNAGASAARNRALREARGELVAFLDSDDAFLPEKLEVQVAFMQAHPEVVMSYTSYFESDSALKPIRVYAADSYPRGWRDMLKGCTIATPTVMIRRPILEQTGLFDETLPVSEDLDLWCRATLWGIVQPLAQPLTRVRIHPSGTPRNHRQMIDIWLQLVRKFYKGDITFTDWLDKQHTISNLYSYVTYVAMNQHAPSSVTLRYLLNALLRAPLSANSRNLLKAYLRS